MSRPIHRWLWLLVWFANSAYADPGEEFDAPPVRINPDAGYNQLQYWLGSTAQRLDDFFGSDEIVDEEPWSQVRISGTQYWSERKDPDFDFKIRGKLRLPKLKHRLALVFEKDGESDSSQPNESSARENSAGENGGSAALVLDVDDSKKRGKRRFFLGLHGGLKEPSLYVRAQYHRRWVSPLWSLRAKPDIEFDSREKLSLRLPFYVERALGRKWYYRNRTRLSWYENDPSVGLDLDFTLFKRLAKKKYVALDWQNHFKTDSAVGPGRQRTLLQLRFRRSMWKHRLFFEIAPGMVFEKGYDFDTEGVLYFRLEMVSESLRQLEPH